MKKMLWRLCLPLLGLLPLAAQADIWGFVDSKGVAHFAAERLDDRYELFFRGDERFDTARPEALAVFAVRPGDQPAAAATPLSSGWFIWSTTPGCWAGRAANISSVD